MADNDGGHVYDYFFRGPHPFDAYPPARWPAGVLEVVPETETESQQIRREQREKYRACRVMGGRALSPGDLDNERIDRHIEACVAKGLANPYEWAFDGPLGDGRRG
jgi:hypothetical protein